MKIQKFILLVSTALILLSFTLAKQNDYLNSYCEGWEKGYKEGYCYGDYGCVAPIPPVCPTPNAGESNYKDGYNRGFVTGKKKKENRDQNNIDGGAYGQLKPLESSNHGDKIRNYIRREKENKIIKNRLLPKFREAKEKATKAFNEENYWECINLYNNSKNFGWYDSEFELMAGISYGMTWKKSKNKSHFKKAKRLLKLSKKHKNRKAKKFLNELKEAEKNNIKKN